MFDGDDTAQNIDELRMIHQRHVANYYDAGNTATTKRALVADANDNGTINFWNPTEKMNLTYCIPSEGNGKFNADQYPLVVAAMNEATADWESSVQVNIAGTYSVYPSPSPPDGAQVLWLSAVGWAGNSVYLPMGRYVVAFEAARRQNGYLGNDLGITARFGAVEAGTITPVGFNYRQYCTDAVIIPSARS